MNPMNSDRENTRNFLENTHIFVQLLFSFWGDWKCENECHKKAKFSKLRNFEIFFGLILVIYEIKF